MNNWWIVTPAAMSCVSVPRDNHVVVSPLFPLFGTILGVPLRGIAPIAGAAVIGRGLSRWRGRCVGVGVGVIVGVGVGVRVGVGWSWERCWSRRWVVVGVGVTVGVTSELESPLESVWQSVWG